MGTFPQLSTLTQNLGTRSGAMREAVPGETQDTHLPTPARGPQKDQCATCSQVQLSKSMSIIGLNNRSLGWGYSQEQTQLRNIYVTKKSICGLTKALQVRNLLPTAPQVRVSSPSCCLLFLNTKEEPFWFLQDSSFPNMFVYAPPPVS